MADPDQTSVAAEPRLRFRDDAPHDEPAVTLDAFLAGQQRPSLLATESAEIPSAEEIGAEFEQFLRGVSDTD